MRISGNYVFWRTICLSVKEVKSRLPYVTQEEYDSVDIKPNPEFIITDERIEMLAEIFAMQYAKTGKSIVIYREIVKSFVLNDLELRKIEKKYVGKDAELMDKVHYIMYTVSKFVLTAQYKREGRLIHEHALPKA